MKRKGNKGICKREAQWWTEAEKSTLGRDSCIGLGRTGRRKLESPWVQDGWTAGSKKKQFGKIDRTVQNVLPLKWWPWGCMNWWWQGCRCRHSCRWMWLRWRWGRCHWRGEVSHERGWVIPTNSDVRKKTMSKAVTQDFEYLMINSCKGVNTGSASNLNRQGQGCIIQQCASWQTGIEMN